MSQNLPRHSTGDAGAGILNIEYVEAGGQTLRVGVRVGDPQTTPLLLFNGIGANLELLETFIAAIPGVHVIAFDVPGVGGSPMPRWPYRFAHLARLADALLTKLGIEGQVDALGVSWGGALAQQFARTCPRRCRRLILAATAAGALMVPGRPSVIGKLGNPRRYWDSDYLAKVGGRIYGGVYRKNPKLLRDHAKHIKPPRGRGYLYQLMAVAGWSSAWWLRRLTQPTLVMMGSDDPILPVINGRILAALIPNSRLHIVDDGHLFLVTRAREIAPIVREFLDAPDANRTAVTVEYAVAGESPASGVG